MLVLKFNHISKRSPRRPKQVVWHIVDDISKCNFSSENYCISFGIPLIFDSISPTDNTVYPKKYAHGFCFAVLCCGYTLTDFSISTRLTSLALWQSNDCPSASKATLMNMDKYFMWIHYERLHNHSKAKHNKTVCIFLGIYCKSSSFQVTAWLWAGVWRWATWSMYTSPWFDDSKLVLSVMM